MSKKFYWTAVFLGIFVLYGCVKSQPDSPELNFKLHEINLAYDSSDAKPDSVEIRFFVVRNDLNLDQSGYLKEPEHFDFDYSEDLPAGLQAESVVLTSAGKQIQQQEISENGAIQLKNGCVVDIFPFMCEIETKLLRDTGSGHEVFVNIKFKDGADFSRKINIPYPEEKFKAPELIYPKGPMEGGDNFEIQFKDTAAQQYNVYLNQCVKSVTCSYDNFPIVLYRDEKSGQLTLNKDEKMLTGKVQSQNKPEVKIEDGVVTLKSNAKFGGDFNQINVLAQSLWIAPDGLKVNLKHEYKSEIMD